MTEQQQQPKPSAFFRVILDRFTLDGAHTLIPLDFTSNSDIKIRGLRLDNCIHRQYLHAFFDCQCEVCTRNRDEDDEDDEFLCTIREQLITQQYKQDIYETFDKLIEKIEQTRHCSECKNIEKINDMVDNICTRCYSKQQWQAYQSAITIPTTKSCNKQS